MSHSVGAAQILKSRGKSGPKNDFERLLLLSLRGPVVSVLSLAFSRPPQVLAKHYAR